MIAENSYLIPDAAMKEYACQGEFILIATDLEMEEKAQGQEAVISGIQAVENSIKEILLDVDTKMTTNQNAVDRSIEGLKLFIIKNMPTQEVETNVHNSKLQRMTLFNMRMIHGSEFDEVKCKGINFTGCFSGTSESSTQAMRIDEAEKLYHCSKCNFDMCTKCMNNYGDIHRHPMEEMSYEELKKRDGNYSSGWGCDCRNFKSCRTDQGLGFKSSDEYAIMFHDADTQFNLCEKCADFYKA